MKANPRNGPMVYIASAYSGDIKRNTEKTKEYSAFAVREGASPLNPILNLDGVLSEKTDRETAMAIDLALLSSADEIWVFGIPTDGMLCEIDAAKEQGIPRRWFSEDMEEL